MSTLTEAYEFRQGARFKTTAFDATADSRWLGFQHRHEYYEFLLVLSGRMGHELNGRKQALKERFVCAMSPSDTHCYARLTEKDRAYCRNFTVRSDFYAETIGFLGLKETAASSLFGVYEVSEDIWSGIVRKGDALGLMEGWKDNPYAEATAKALLIDLSLAAPREDGPPVEGPPDWLRFAVEKFLEEQNWEDGLRRLIALSGKTQEHLTRCVKRYYGETPTALINRARIRYAAELLSLGRLKIDAITRATGFESQAYFNKLFRDFYGVTPTEYVVRRYKHRRL